MALERMIRARQAADERRMPGRTTFLSRRMSGLALNPWETIGSIGARNFMLCKKPQMEKAAIEVQKDTIGRKGNGTWKAWFNKSLNLKISSH
ncbi:hypothetical protein U1Q18_029688 [Sarracenia purpurea var. burkii]